MKNYIGMLMFCSLWDGQRAFLEGDTDEFPWSMPSIGGNHHKEFPRWIPDKVRAFIELAAKYDSVVVVLGGKDTIFGSGESRRYHHMAKTILDLLREMRISVPISE